MTTKSEILKAIRRKCIECCCGQMAEVRLCHLRECELWPYRFGMDPNPAKPRGIANPVSREAIYSGKGSST